MIGCARTIVRKDPTDTDEGLRFYRSKPYLKLVDAVDKDGYVTITVEHLPDFTEEYAVKIRAGLGKNHTSVTLNDAGVLTGLDADVDSNFAEILKAATGAIPGAKATGASDARAASDTAMCVAAYQVPNGFYEAVVSRGHDGRKRLYGWRYVGFAPFNQCPMESSGVECTTCENTCLYGLVNIGGRMMFRPLSEIASKPVDVCIPATSPPAKLDCSAKESMNTIIAPSLIAKLSQAGLAAASVPDDIEIKPSDDCKTFTVTYTVTEAPSAEDEQTIIDLTKRVISDNTNLTKFTITPNFKKR